MNEIIKINLFGEEFRFKPDADAENPEKIVHDLEKYIKQAENKVKDTRSEKHKTAVLLLAAMNVSKDYNELKKQHDEFEKEIDKRLSFILKKLEKGSE